MPHSKKQIGSFGEDLAAKFLRRHGFKILKRNLTSKIGEIDILARQKDVIVIVEVKTKSSQEFGEGFEMVNYFKQKKLLSLAKSLQTKYPDRTIRIDVISVNTSVNPPEIKHFENAVEDNE
jgi:putative endonuclease